jgi:hypothetical protein
VCMESSVADPEQSDKDPTFHFGMEPDPYCFNYCISGSARGQPPVIYFTIYFIRYRTVLSFYFSVSIFVFLQTLAYSIYFTRVGSGSGKHRYGTDPAK